MARMCLHVRSVSRQSQWAPSSSIRMLYCTPERDSDGMVQPNSVATMGVDSAMRRPRATRVSSALSGLCHGGNGL